MTKTTETKNIETMTKKELKALLIQKDESLRVALSVRRTTQKENSEFFITKKEEVFKFNNLNEVSKHVENFAESYLKVLQVRLSKEKFTSIEFKQQLIQDLNKIVE